MKIQHTLLAAALLLPISFTAQADNVIRHALGNFPTSLAVEVPANVQTVYLNGVVPSVINKDADPHNEAAYGNTEQQTDNVLSEIEKRLKDLGLSMNDVVKMQVYLKAPQGQENMDFQGFSKSYLRFFNKESGINLPARSLFQVLGFANPAWLVEIEVIAVRQ